MQNDTLIGGLDSSAVTPKLRNISFNGQDFAITVLRRSQSLEGSLALQIQKHVGFSADRTTMSLNVDLKEEGRLGIWLPLEMTSRRSA